MIWLNSPVEFHAYSQVFEICMFNHKANLHTMEWCSYICISICWLLLYSYQLQRKGSRL